MTPQTGPGDTRGMSHPDADRESPAPRLCHIVEVNEDRDTEGSEDRDGATDSTSQPHSPTVEIPGQTDTDTEAVPTHRTVPQQRNTP